MTSKSSAESNLQISKLDLGQEFDLRKLIKI